MISIIGRFIENDSDRLRFSISKHKIQMDIRVEIDSFGNYLVATDFIRDSYTFPYTSIDPKILTILAQEYPIGQRNY